MQKIAPYVSDRRKKRRRLKAYFFGVIGVLALYGAFWITQWIIFHSPLFRVDHVVVAGNTTMASSDVLALVQASALPQHEIFPAVYTFHNMMLWPDRVASSELVMAPTLASVNIAKDYFAHTVTITATDRAPAGIWCYTRHDGASAATETASSSVAVTSGGTNCYWFDNTGTLFAKSLNTEGNLIYVVNDSAQMPKGLNQKVLPPDFLFNFLSAAHVLQQAHLGVKSIALTNLALEQVDVQTVEGPTIYFSLRFPADEYLPVIQKVMQQPNFAKLQYIDCTTENRVYYK